MSDINRWHGSGRLTRDPEVRTTQGGTQILAMGMCCNDRRQDQRTGEWEDVPNFIDVILFGKRADFLAQHLHKGSKVYVEGRLHWSQWEKDGAKRSKLEVIASEIEFELPPKKDAQTYGQGVAPMPAQQYQQAAYQPQTPTQQYQQPAYQQPAQQYQQAAYQPPTQQYQQPAAYQPQQPAAAYQAPQQPQQPQQVPQQIPLEYDVYDEDIPF